MKAKGIKGAGRVPSTEGGRLRLREVEGRAARMQIFAATEIETIRQLESSTRTGLCRFAPPARWRTGLAAAAARASLIQSAELSYES